MKRWFADGLFRSVMKNAGYLLSSKLVGALLGLVALVCAARGLDPKLFGALALIHAYATGAAAISKFQSWQVIIRFGGPALARGDTAPVRDAIRFGLALDLLSGVVGMACAMILLPFLAATFGVDGHYFWFALAYCLLIPTMGSAVELGTLRLFQRFDLIARQQVITPLIRATGAALAWHFDAGLPTYVAAWFAADLIGDLVLWACAIRELRRNAIRGWMRPTLRAVNERLEGAWHFAWTTNLSVTVHSAWGPVANLVVGAVLGPAPAGLYKVATTVLEAVGRPADIIEQGFYPAIMRLNPASKAPWRLGLRTAVLAAAVGFVLMLVLVAGGKPLIGYGLGADYLAAYGLLAIMCGGLVVSMVAFPCESLLYMVGREKTALKAEVGGTIVYLVGLGIFCHAWGMIGAGWAYLFGTLSLTIFKLIPTISSYRHRARYARAEHPEAGMS